MKETVEDLIPVGDYETLLNRIKWSERLNVLLFLSVLFVAFFAFVAVGVHTYQYEKRLQRQVNEFRQDVLAITGDQNLAIQDLNQLVSDRSWVSFQRLSIEQLNEFIHQHGYKGDSLTVTDAHALEADGVGGK